MQSRKGTPRCLPPLHESWKSAWRSGQRRSCFRRSRSELFTTLGGQAMTRPRAAARAGVARARQSRFLRHAGGASLSRARRRWPRGPLSQYGGNGALPRPEQPSVHRRLPGNGQRPPLSLLGRSHRRAPHGKAAERDQAHRRADVRRALQQAGAARTVHGCDERDFRGQLPGLRGEVRLLALSDALRCRAARPASCRCSSPGSIRT